VGTETKLTVFNFMEYHNAGRSTFHVAKLSLIELNRVRAQQGLVAYRFLAPGDLWTLDGIHQGVLPFRGTEMCWVLDKYCTNDKCITENRNRYSAWRSTDELALAIFVPVNS
jgi:hypothetical protein